MISKAKALLISTLFVIFLASCKKHSISDLSGDEHPKNETRFFQMANNKSTGVLQANRYLYEKNREKEFVSKFIQLAGYPKWDKGFFLSNRALNQQSQSRTMSTDSTYIIPVVSENDSRVTGAIIATMGSAPTYHLVLLNDFQLYNSDKETFIKAMMILDAKVYGYNKFKIQDSSVVNNTKEIFFTKASTSSGSNQTLTVNADDPCEIMEIWYNPDGDACNCTDDEYYTGDWYYADEENCNSPVQQPVLYYFFYQSGGGGYQLPSSYYTLPSMTGGGGGGSIRPPYNPVPYTEAQQKDYLVQQLHLNQTQEFYLVNTPGAINTIFNYVYTANTIERRNMAIWVLNFIPNNQDIPFSSLDNWFFKQPEYTGGEPIIDPNQITYDQPVQQVPLPSLSSFETNFPKLGVSGNYMQMPSPDVYQLVGATLYSNHLSGNPNYQNACSIRGSRGLLYAGITIPVLKYNNSQRTEKGSDNKNYILDAVSFNKFMIDKFGDTPNKLTGADANDPQKVADLLKNKNGIYVIVNNDGTANGARYSGHVDLILNGNCIGGAYTTPTGGVKSIRVWVLN